MLRHLVERLDGDEEAAYVASGLDYRPRYTPVVRSILALGPCTIRQIALSGTVTQIEAARVLAEMSDRGLVSASEAPGGRLYSLTGPVVDMLPALERAWTDMNRAAASLSENVGVDLEAVVERAIHELRNRAFIDRILEARRSAGSAAGRER